MTGHDANTLVVEVRPGLWCAMVAFLGVSGSKHHARCYGRTHDEAEMCGDLIVEEGPMLKRDRRLIRLGAGRAIGRR